VVHPVAVRRVPEEALDALSEEHRGPVGPERVALGAPRSAPGGRVAVAPASTGPGVEGLAAPAPRAAREADPVAARADRVDPAAAGAVPSAVAAVRRSDGPGAVAATSKSSKLRS
jgi:hypothetical protein